MKFRLPRPRDLAHALRDTARSRPDEAEEYLETHRLEWEALAGSTPADAADILEALPEEAAANLIGDLAISDAADVLDEMNPAAAADLLEEMSPGDAADLLEEMQSDHAADVVGALEERPRHEILDELEAPAAAQVEALLAHAPDSAGGLMGTDVATLPLGISAGEAIEALRRMSEEQSISYVFVTTLDGQLQGVVSFRDLVFARPGTGLDEVMVENPVSAHTSTDREEVAELIQRYHLLALPVVDDDGKLVGIVKFGDAMAAAQEEASEDLAQMVGAGAEETISTPVLLSVRRRLPWIVVNLMIGLLLAAAIGRFESTIERNAVLIGYLPLASLLGGNSGAQSLAVLIRTMAISEIPQSRTWRVIRRQLAIGSINGLVMALLAGLVAGLTTGALRPGVVVGIAVLTTLIAAGVAGAGIPLLLKRLGLDPALAANIFLTLVTDMVGFGTFLVFTSLLL